MTLCGDMAVGKDIGPCKDMAASYRHSLPTRFIAWKTALLPRNLARFRAEYPRQSRFHAQKCAGTYFAQANSRIPFENSKI